MNSELFEKTAASRLTRRKVVTTGTKLAYGAPVLAASFKLSTMGALAGAEHSCDCVDDELSPKQLEGGCYTCKVPESGCVATQSNVQAADLLPNLDGHGLACICQGNTCVINGHTFQKGENVTAALNGACAPYNLANTKYDDCGGVGNVSPQP